MALYCVHCDHTFEPEGSERPRCPKCMRVNDLREVEAGQPAGATEGGSTRRLGLRAVLVLVLAVAFGILGYYFMGDSGEEGDRDTEELGQILQKKGVDADALGWVEPTPAVTAFAERATAEASGETEQIEALVGHIRARAQVAAFVPWSLGETLARHALRPDAVIEVLREKGGRARLYPLEVVALARASARALDLPVQVVELVAWPHEKAPLDPSGVAGYYALSHDGKIHDVFAGRTVPDDVKAVPISDVELVGAGLGLEAVALASADGELQQATRLSEQALKLAPKSPTVRCDRAAVWAAAGAIDQALEEFEAAAQLRRDAARRYHLASAALLTGDADKANAFLSKLLAEYEDYALARVSVAALEMRQGNVEEARRQLDLAEQSAPDLHAVMWARAELLAAQGDTAAAKPLARRAFEGRKTLDSYLRYAQFQRKVGDLSGSAETVVAALEAAPESRRGELHESLRALVGPAVMMDVDAALSGDEPSASDTKVGDLELDLGELDLGEPMDLGRGGAAGGPKLGDSDDGPLLMMGDTSKLKLRGNKQGGLELDLPE